MQPASLVVMGVAGCGKSTVGALVAPALRMTFVDGDAFHDAHNRRTMQAGIPLTEADRAPWLDRIGARLAQGDVVIACSALRREHRDKLRAAAPGVRFAFLDLPRDEALRRVAARGDMHFFPASLVDDQYATLERPDHEPDVLRIDALQAPHAEADAILAWASAQ